MQGEEQTPFIQRIKELRAEHGAFVKVLYSLFDDKRREVRAEKAKYIRELTDPDHAWGNENEQEEQQESQTAATVVAAGEGAGGEETKYEALYDYAAQNDDELSFAAGDVVMVGFLACLAVSFFKQYTVILVHLTAFLYLQVSLGQVGEPGWLAGRIGEKSGWIPEAYLKKADEAGAAQGAEGGERTRF